MDYFLYKNLKAFCNLPNHYALVNYQTDADYLIESNKKNDHERQADEFDAALVCSQRVHHSLSATP